MKDKLFSDLVASNNIDKANEDEQLNIYLRQPALAPPNVLPLHKTH